MWTEEQSLAIEKQNSNILVSASAGSGKTAVLVERVINKVINYKIDIDKILVVTFTNAAAAELKERLMLAIYKALNENKEDKFLKRQLTYINRASITTIHSFCLNLIRSNFDSLAIDPNFKICDEAESNILKAKAITTVLEKKYTLANSDNDEKEKLYNLLELFGSKEENLSEYILKIYSYIQSFEYPFEWLQNSVEKYNIDENIDLYDTDYGKEIYEDIIKELEIIVKKAEEVMKEIEDNEDFIKYFNMLDEDVKKIKLCLFNETNSFDKLYEGLRNIDFPRTPIYKGDNKDLKEKIVSFRNDVLKKTIENAKKSIYEKSEVILKENKKAYKYIKYLCDIIEKFSNEYSKLKRNKNYIDFNDIEHLALSLLVEKDDEEKYVLTDIALNLQDKFKEVYTDEYQDISYIQEAILNSVSSGNNRFMVGDIKQSIYRFRQAVPDIFNEKYLEYNLVEKEDIENIENIENKDTKIILAKNFRSRKEVLESINYIFTKIMSQELGDSNYTGIETLKFGASSYEDNKSLDYSTDINIINLKSEQNTSNKNFEQSEEETEIDEYINELKKFEIESIYVAKKVNEIVKNNKTYNLKTNEVKNTTYKDIVILLRSIKDKGAILEETFKKYNIPIFCDVSSNLFDTDEVNLVLSLLKILDNSYLDIELISVMYSIIGNFTLDELVYIRNIDKKSKVFTNLLFLKEKKKEIFDTENDFEKSLICKVEQFLSLIDKLKNYASIYSISKLLIKIYDITNVYRQYNLDKNALGKKSNLNLLIDIAYKCQSQDILSLSEYITYINNLKDKVDNSSSSAKIIGENENVVRIMTIHKSKGLEFPYVILCDTSKKYNMLDRSSTVTMHSKLGLGINIINDNYKITYPSVIKQAIKSKLTKETKSEELRMLYVALTRAKEKLYIFATVNDYDKINNKQVVIYNNDKIDSLVVQNNNSYFENINMALKEYDENDKLFNIKIIEATTNIKEDIKLLQQETNVKNISLEEIIKNRISSKEKNIKKIKEIKEKINFEYDYQNEINIPKRVSVSQLKKEDIEENIQYFDNINLKNKEVDITKKYNINEIVSSDERNYSSVRKGTLIHFVLENLDMSKKYTKDSLKEYINELSKDGYINKNDLNHININKILNFLNSKIGEEIYESNFVKKEHEFILKDKSISLSVIQGIIDIYYKNERGEFILIDFKTDRLDEDIEYVKRYKKQLEIYKIALEKLYEIKVKHTYIYSFYLDREIEVFDGE